MKKKQIASAKARGVKEAIITKVRQRRIVKKAEQKEQYAKKPAARELPTWNFYDLIVPESLVFGIV